MKKTAGKRIDTKNPEKSAESRNKRSLPFRFLDFVIIAAVILISLAPLLFLPKSEGRTVIITWHGQEIYRGDIGKDETIVTPDGLNTIVIKDGAVRMQSAECRDHICVKSGSATPARPIVCLPNRVVVTVTGTEEVDSGTW